MDRQRKHQRNQLVSPTKGRLCQKKTRRSKSSGYNQVKHQIKTWQSNHQDPPWISKIKDKTCIIHIHFGGNTARIV